MSGASQRARRVLVVDDDLLVRTMLADALRARGFEVLTAETGRQALEQLMEELLDLDVLVTDLYMPQMDGEALVKKIRVSGGEQDLAIVVMSGRISHAPSWVPGVAIDAVVDKAIGPEGIAVAVEAASDRRCRSEAAAVDASAAHSAVPIFHVSYASSAELLADAQLLAAGGVFVRGASLAMGSEAAVHVVLPDGEMLRGRGTVVSVTAEGAGVALEFEAAGREQLAAQLLLAGARVTRSPPSFRELWWSVDPAKTRK